MDRGIPTPSKIISRKMNDRNREIHLLKLNSIKSTISRVPPPSFSHMKSNKKKIQVTEDRLTQIEKENKQLLDRLTVIMRSAYNTQSGERMASRSLNRDSRKRDLVKITIENQAFSKRLQEQKSVYDRGVWENDEKQREGYLKNISEYPFTLLDQSDPERSDDRPQSFQLSRGDFTSFISSPNNMTNKLNSTSKDIMNTSVRKLKNEKLTPVNSSKSQQILHQTKKKIGFSSYLIHIYTHNETLNIIASNNERADFKTLSLPKSEGQKLISLFNGDFEALIDQIYFQGAKILLKDINLDQTNKNSMLYKSNEDIIEANDEHDQENNVESKNIIGRHQSQGVVETNLNKTQPIKSTKKPHIVEIMKKEQKKAQLNQTKAQNQPQPQKQIQPQVKHQNQPQTQPKVQSQVQTKSQPQVQPQIHTQSPNKQQSEPVPKLKEPSPVLMQDEAKPKSDNRNIDQELNDQKKQEDLKEIKKQNQSAKAEQQQSTIQQRSEDDQKQTSKSETGVENEDLKDDKLRHGELVDEEGQNIDNEDEKPSESVKDGKKDSDSADENQANGVVEEDLSAASEKAPQNLVDESEKQDLGSELKESVNAEDDYTKSVEDPLVKSNDHEKQEKVVEEEEAEAEEDFKQDEEEKDDDDAKEEEDVEEEEDVKKEEDAEEEEDAKVEENAKVEEDAEEEEDAKEEDKYSEDFEGEAKQSPEKSNRE